MMFVVFDCEMKLLSLIMKSLASGNMVVVRQIDDGNRRLLNSCQRLNTGHKLANHGEFFPCSIFLLRMIFPPNLALQQVYYLKNETAARHEWILSSQEGFNDRHERAEAGRCIDEGISDVPRMKMLRGKKS